MAPASVHPDGVLNRPLTEREFRRLGTLSRRLPLAWIATPRRRRLFLLGLATPGFLLLVSTPFHRVFGLLVAGLVLFAAALLFRQLTEHVFVRAEAVEIWPPPHAPLEITDWKDHRHG